MVGFAISFPTILQYDDCLVRSENAILETSTGSSYSSRGS